MDTRYRPFVKLEMSRHDAKELLALVKADTTMINGARKRIKKELVDGLKPLYYYEVQCYDCHRFFEVVSEKKCKLSEIVADLDKGDGLGILCSNCQEDYK